MEENQMTDSDTKNYSCVCTDYYSEMVTNNLYTPGIWWHLVQQGTATWRGLPASLQNVISVAKVEMLTMIKCELQQQQYVCSQTILERGDHSKG